MREKNIQIAELDSVLKTEADENYSEVTEEKQKEKIETCRHLGRIQRGVKNPSLAVSIRGDY